MRCLPGLRAWLIVLLNQVHYQCYHNDLVFWLAPDDEQCVGHKPVVGQPTRAVGDASCDSKAR